MPNSFITKYLFVIYQILKAIIGRKQIGFWILTKLEALIQCIVDTLIGWSGLQNRLLAHTELDGLNFCFRPLFLNELYMALGIWEPYVVEIFKPLKGETVLDVGAHTGYYTLKAAKAVGPEGMVISVEPDPRNFKILKRNVQDNNLFNVKLFNCALGATSNYGELRLTHNPLFSQLIQGQKNKDSHKIKVEKMDELCDHLGVHKLNWVKIDVEKGDTNVLRGGRRILDHPTKIIIEVSGQDTLDLLLKMGYSFRKVSPHLRFGYYYVVKDA